MIIELRLCPDQGPQINRLPVGRVFGEGQASPWPRDWSESSVGSRGGGVVGLPRRGVMAAPGGS